jgi:hypothetical protein
MIMIEFIKTIFRGSTPVVGAYYKFTGSDKHNPYSTTWSVKVLEFKKGYVLYEVERSSHVSSLPIYKFNIFYTRLEE